MTKHKTIHEIFETWGKNKKETPSNNDVLKSEILSKIPVVINKAPTYNHLRSPWLSYTFATMSVIALLINYTGDNISKDFAVSDISFEAPSTVTVGYEGPARDSVQQTIPTYNNSNKTAVVSNESGAMYARDVDMMYRPAPMPQSSSPVSDKREFLKISYNATLRTRQISDTTNRIEIIVRGFDGRIDQANSTEKWGYVSFAIPKNKFEAFREEAKSLVGDKFYIEQTNSQNLLSQKQNIEQNQTQTEKNLKNLKTERELLVKNHNQNISSYYSRIDFLSREISALNLEYKTATPVRQIEITKKIAELQKEISIIQSEITNENRSYQVKKSGIDTNVRYTEENLGYIEAQDKNFTEDVATVNGTISLKWISLWEVADTYSPGPLLAWIFLGLALISFFWYKRATRETFDLSL